MGRRYFISVLQLVLITIFFIGCTANKLDVDVSKIDVDLTSKRFNRDIFNADYNNLLKLKQDLNADYGSFYTVFVEQIIRIGSQDSLSTIKELQLYTQDEFVKNVEKQIDKKFSEKGIEDFSRGIEDAFKHWKYYFPKKNIPTLTFYNSGFNYGIVTMDEYLGVGLDFYLGAEDSLVKLMPGEIFHQYERDKMDEKFLVRDAIDGWVRKEFESLKDKSDLLGLMVYEGKMIYLLNAMLPTADDAELMRYFENEILWVEKNKKQIWKQLAKQEVIFGVKNFDNQKWVNEGPFTNTGAMPENSPARIGVWVGWQMVSAYMDAHPELTVQELLNGDNKTKILSNYKP